MATIAYNPIDNMVQSMREIRDEISNEIKDMTFAEERAFLDKALLRGNEKINIKKTKGKPSVKSDL